MFADVHFEAKYDYCLRFAVRWKMKLLQVRFCDGQHTKSLGRSAENVASKEVASNHTKGRLFTKIKKVNGATLYWRETRKRAFWNCDHHSAAPILCCQRNSTRSLNTQRNKSACMCVLLHPFNFSTDVCTLGRERRALLCTDFELLWRTRPAILCVRITSRYQNFHK